jgi:glycosyltransferase involved in cell wall biosynthesis
MPVYNAERYLREAIESILAQTYADFELLIIDDGSTDSSIAIIESYADPRIRLVRNGQNRGVVYTLNRGLALARGRFLARMDSDDIALPHRLERQTAVLEAHPETAVVASTIQQIDENGAPAGSWEEDVAALTSQAIQKMLVKGNCIAHPSILGRTSLLQRYGYSANMLHTEDYELWLRICGDGHTIEKISEPLLKYRSHAQSVTVASNRGGYGDTIKLLRSKAGFITKKIKARSWNGFATEVLRSFSGQLLRLVQKILVQQVKRGLYACGGLLGRLISCCIKNDDPSQPAIFMIFPFCHTGGAERVHADIIACFRQYLPRVLIVSRSDNTAFKKAFAEGSRLVDISFFCELLITRFIAMGFLAEWISRTENAVVFSSNSFLFCRMLPLFSEGVKKIDLTHAFSAGTELVSLPYVPLLDARVVISRKTADDFAALYAEHRIDPAYLERISIIENKVPVPPAYREKPFGKKKILFVGRGSPEKRVHLVGRIAHAYAALDPEASFTLVGDVQQRILPGDCPYCIFAGEILDDSILAGMYREAHVLLITSEREGLPLVLMEAMAHGVVPVSTNVGAIGAHVQNGSNGFLIEARDEESLAAAFVAAIKQALSDQNDYQHLSLNAHRCVLEKSARNDDFCRDYVRLLVGQNSNPGKKRGAES